LDLIKIIKNKKIRCIMEQHSNILKYKHLDIYIQNERVYKCANCCVRISKGFSAHADYKELIDWMQKIKNLSERVFIIHGEKESAEALQKGIKETYGWEAEDPQLYSIENV
tara:strand:+ start:9602 stop:9934 length:333 start_codon:yes stop_codon:yes gene_type:complete